MASTNAVADYWTKGNTLKRILQALETAGVALEGISITDLAPIDQFHARGLAGTIDLANRLPIASGQNLLDIGCGIGGPARYMADRFDCHVSGLDITPGFITAGEELNRLTRMDDKVDLRVGDGVTLPYGSAYFDGAFSQHVTMNVADRAGFFAEAFRVIKPGGFFGLSEHGLGPNGDPVFPLPWADRADICHMIPPGETEHLLDTAGFVGIELLDTGSRYVNGYNEVAAKMKADGPSVLGPHVIGGEDIPLRSSNSIQCIEEGRSSPIEVVCFKPV